MGELETTVAAPFVHMRVPALSHMKLIFYYTQDKRWMGIDHAKKLIAIAESAGFISKNEAGEYVLDERLRTGKIPLGFKPTDAIFSEQIPARRDPIEALLAEVAQASKKNVKDLISEMQDIRNAFDNLIADDAAIIVLAKKYGVKPDAYVSELIEKIESD